jgi:hypothetical protein
MSQEDRLNGANQRQILGESAGFTKCAADKNITIVHVFLFSGDLQIDQFGGDHGPAFRQEHEQQGNLGDVPLGVAQPLPGGLEAFELDLRPKLEQSLRLADIESDVGGIVSSLKDEQGVSNGIFQSWNSTALTPKPTLQLSSGEFLFRYNNRRIGGCAVGTMPSHRDYRLVDSQSRRSVFVADQINIKGTIFA